MHSKLFDDTRAFETNENETVTARGKTAKNLDSLDTDLDRAGPMLVNSSTSADVKKTGDWSEVDSDGTSSTDAELETRKKRRRLQQSARGRATAIATVGGDSTLANLSFLERVQATETKYKARVEDFLCFADEQKLALAADDEADAAIEQYLNTSCSQGRPVSDEELLLVGLMFLQPQCGKSGGQEHARSWRALQGCRKRAPTRSRCPLPRMIWSGIWEM